jgi:hypothetical protein
VFAEAAAQIDLAVRNVRVLARGAIRALTLGENVPPEVADALEDLADAVVALAATLDDRTGLDAVREPALRAAATATLVLERTGNLSVSVIVGQIRSTAVDLGSSASTQGAGLIDADAAGNSLAATLPGTQTITFNPPATETTTSARSSSPAPSRTSAARSRQAPGILITAARPRISDIHLRRPAGRVTGGSTRSSSPAARPPASATAPHGGRIVGGSPTVIIA